MKTYHLNNYVFLKSIRTTLFALLLVSFCVHAQYRRRHADITKELSRLLEIPNTDQYYFSLLPQDLSSYVCILSGLDLDAEMYGAFFINDSKMKLFLKSLSLRSFEDRTRYWATYMTHTSTEEFIAKLSGKNTEIAY